MYKPTSDQAAKIGVNRIIVRLDSPGGQVAGTAETGALIRELRAGGIQVVAFVDGMAASGAYWIASQCNRVIASSATALVGSIGAAWPIIETLSDEKKQRITVLKSAPAKGVGPLNDEQRSNIQALVNDMAATFIGEVASGRSLTPDQIAKISTAEVWTARVAQSLGLVDEIASFAAVLSRSSSTTRRIPPRVSQVAAATFSGGPMKITAEAMLGLLVQHPQHAALITSRAATDDEATITAAIQAQIRADEVAALATAQSSLEKVQVALSVEQTAHKAVEINNIYIC